MSSLLSSFFFFLFLFSLLFPKHIRKGATSGKTSPDNPAVAKASDLVQQAHP
jgi:hypothetical protein